MVKVVMGVVGSFTLVVMDTCCPEFYDFAFNRMETKPQADR